LLQPCPIYKFNPVKASIQKIANPLKKFTRAIDSARLECVVVKKAMVLHPKIKTVQSRVSLLKSTHAVS
jgi:hypothetical protein